MAKITVDKIIELPNNQKIIILLLIISLIIAGYIFFFFMPQRDDITVKREEVLKLQAKFNEQQNILSNLPRFKQELKIMQTKFEDSLKMLPNAREIPSLLTNITTLAKESGLEIKFFKPKPEIRMDFYAKIPVDMKIVGRYHQLGVFFDKLARLPRIINILDVKIKKMNSQTGKKTSNIIYIAASFNATTFKFIDKTGGKPDARKKKRR